MPFCAYCGTEVALGLAACPQCGHPQSASAASTYVPAEGQTTDGMAIAALVTSLIGCFPVGLVLGIVALRRIRKDPTKKGDGLAIGGIVLAALNLLMIPVLVAIAVPTFLGARERAQDRHAERQLVIAVDAYSDAPTNTPPPSPQFVAAQESTGPNIVSVYGEDPRDVIYALRSDSGSCLAVRQRPEGILWGVMEQAPTCNGATFPVGSITYEQLPLGQP